MRTIALYATETMADWEYAYLTTQITVLERLRPGRFQLLLVGDGTQPVTSLGGLPLTPAHDLDVLTPLTQEGSLAALVIPGGDTYTSAASAERGPHGRLVEAVRAVVDHGVPVAAICGATYLLAHAGLLDTRAHTSNAASFLEASDYGGADHYVDAPVVTDQGITTAAGTDPIPFTAEIMRLTGLAPAPVADAWERLYLTGLAQHYTELLEAVDAWQNS
ncbi:DJ-1/PfpI family protein [Actinomyces bowdenii]|uniref:DJ-1/PfpI family protein n=1 Tax=Actinomyces bowdenii TaxID=131109 RepID=A0A853EJN1_9ACTO|nr:DJ-1/PfpI family protein [Actinomyces bowdenii]MBF0697390.1 DJ-1/PfpI family protein [Actinomyces bowdenii]NYS69563.1 DJ-1/PfpI family protein [Actinomyces bowdenii]